MLNFLCNAIMRAEIGLQTAIEEFQEDLETNLGYGWIIASLRKFIPDKGIWDL